MAEKKRKMIALKIMVVFFSILTITFLILAEQDATENKMSSLVIKNKLLLTTGVAIRKEVIVAVGIYQVWECWTTREGAETFFAPKADIDLAVGGKYELYFSAKEAKGSQGSEGCRILSFIPLEMLSFTWNNPPHLSSIRFKNTWVVLFFNPEKDSKTKVTMVHLGWGAGKEWAEAIKYFSKAWNVVLGRLQYRFLNGPLNWKKPFTPDLGK